MCISFVTSCDIINPEEEIPAYLFVSEFVINNNDDVDEISRGGKIVAANVLIDDVAVGIVSVPGVLPVYDEGTVEVTIDPLVQENGAGDFLQIYPFWTRTEYSTSLVRGDSAFISPTTQYLSGATILGTNFAGADNFFVDDLDGNPETTVTITSVDAQPNEGTIGRIVLTSENPLFDGATSRDIPFETENISRAWLEVQYRTEVPLIFGIRDVGNPGSAIFREYGINIKDEWNTLYFDMLPLLSSQNISQFQLTLTASFPDDFAGSEAEILLDNIKLVYL